MPDNIPFEIQMEIIKMVSDVKSLIQFRSVSKLWKSFIDSSEFIKAYGARHTQPHSHILRYKSRPFADENPKYICLVDDDIQTFKVQKIAPSVVSPLLEQMVSYVVGACHGLVCLYGFHKGYKKRMVVIWIPSIRKSFGIAVPSVTQPYNPGYQTLKLFQNELVFGFGVCPLTRDPTVVKIIQTDKKPWYVEVFTLSSGVWNVIPSSSNLPRQSIKLVRSAQVVIDKFIYWGAWEPTFADGECDANHMVVSFDLITKEFKVVDLPDTLTNEVLFPIEVYKLRGSLVVSGCIEVEGAICCGVWVMEHDSSFRKLFTIRGLCKILGFSKSGETIFETEKEDGRCTALTVYDPCSQQIKNLGIPGVEDSFFMGSYKESLLLLDHPDLHIYSGDS